MAYGRTLAYHSAWITIISLITAVTLLSQTPNYPYVLKAFAGSDPLGDGAPAAQALLSGPSALVLDGLGNTFILDANNYRIRKVSVFGDISTVASTGVAANDMKMGKDGSFYLTSTALVFKISPAGVVTILAGTGTPGSSLDGIEATAAQIGLTGGIALDASGNVYFVDGNRVREVTADGIIHTVAGTASGYLYNGDNRVATTAQLYAPWGIALDSANNLYIADQGNSRVRKVSSGMISTLAGNGYFGMPAPGNALLLPQGSPYGLTLDSAGSVYITDSYFNLALKIAVNGTVTQLAGTQTFGYTDGPSNASYLNQPAGLAVDINGNVFIAEQGANRVREVANGNLSTVAGRLHYAGDGAAATSALLTQPVDLSLDAQGDVLIADGANFRIREVTPNGLIGTYAGSGIPGLPATGVGTAAQLPPMLGMAGDAKGNLYLAALSNVVKISSAGAVSNFAGTGDYGDTGDGAPATKATFELVTGVAVDAPGNVYVADTVANRVRRISAADGTIAPFAGSGKSGYTGDGGLATSGTLNLSGVTPLTVDQKGNVYLGDGGNNVVRSVAPNGILGTAVGNGTLGSPADGAAAKSAVFSPASGLAVDSSGSLYITSHVLPAVYEVDPAGIIHVISGAGTALPVDGSPANSTSGFGGAGLRVDANGDLLVTDPNDGLIWKLVLNSPVSLAVFAGNGQTAAAGSVALQALQAIVKGRAGVGVPGVTVNFAVRSGSATLSAATTQTDARGLAGVGVTLGSAPGDAVITATVAGSTLPPAQFTVTTADSLTLNPQSLAFSYNLGDPAPAPQTLGIGSASGSALSFATGIGVTGDTLWLQIDTANGSTPATAQVSVGNLDSLGAGVYQGSITVTPRNAAPASLSVPVVLTVIDPNAAAPSAVRRRARKRL